MTEPKKRQRRMSVTFDIEPNHPLFPKHEWPETPEFKMSNQEWLNHMAATGKIRKPVADLYDRDMKDVEVRLKRGEPVKEVAMRYGLNPKLLR